MVYVERPQAAVSFLRLLDEAAQLVGKRWFLLPHAVRDERENASAYRERVYCYELYHQLRVLGDTPSGAGAAAGAPDYVLSGEIDKSGLNAVIENGRHKPDLVWHVPGTSEFNAVVVEVKKAVGLKADGLCKDLETLSSFVQAPQRGYERGVLLVFGPLNKPADLQRRVLDAADVVGIDDESRKKIKLLWHPAAGRGIDDLGDLEV